MKSLKPIILLFCLCLFSCKDDSIFDKMDKNFKSNQWEKSETKTYEFAIEDEKKWYNIILKFAHVYDYQFASIPLKISIENPSGEKENIDVDLKIKDANGNEIADCGGDICDLKQIIKEKIKLEKGNYKIVIKHDFKGPYLPNVLGIGVKVSVAQ